MCTTTPTETTPCPTCRNAYGKYRYKCCNIRDVTGNVVSFYIEGSSHLFSVNWTVVADVCTQYSMRAVENTTGWICLSETWLRVNGAPWNTGDPKHPVALEAAPSYITLSAKMSAPRALFVVDGAQGFDTLSAPLGLLSKWSTPMAFGATMPVSDLFRVDDAKIRGLPDATLPDLRDLLTLQKTLVCLGTTYDVKFVNPAKTSEKAEVKDFLVGAKTLVKSPIMTLLASGTTVEIEILESYWRTVTGT